jgi:hypothetical protein
MAKRKASTTVYLVYTSADESYLLEGATQETFMGMKCIRGYYGLSKAKWHFLADRVVRVPCDRVRLIVEYDSLTEYQDAVRQHYQEKAK